jgi:hypothetical protein
MHYVFAPTKAHAIHAAKEEIHRDHHATNVQTLTFNELTPHPFKHEDVILIRGLKSLGVVSKMKFITDTLVHAVAAKECHMMLVGLDTYIVIENQASPILIKWDVMAAPPEPNSVLDNIMKAAQQFKSVV